MTYFWGAYAAYDPRVIPLRDEDVSVDCMVRAAKGELPARSSALVTALDGNTYRIAAGTESFAFDIFGQWGAHMLAQWWRDVMLVPVPSSGHMVFGRSFPGARLAEAIVTHLPQELNINAAPILAYRNPITRAIMHGKSAIQSELRCASELLAGQHAVLIDDVFVSGAHLTACAYYLRSIGAEVGLALCLAKSVQLQHPSPLQVAPEDIEDLSGIRTSEADLVS